MRKKSRLDMIDAAVKEDEYLHPEESFIVEEKNFGLGLTPQRRTIISNMKQTME